jgi:hypothetical protein
MPQRFAAIGNPHAGMDEAAGSLEKLLELAERDEAEGLGDTSSGDVLEMAEKRRRLHQNCDRPLGRQN